MVELTGAGHFLQSDAPQAFADAVRDWHREAFLPLPTASDASAADGSGSPADPARVEPDRLDG